jgi:hypothetical protein
MKAKLMLWSNDLVFLEIYCGYSRNSTILRGYKLERKNNDLNLKISKFQAKIIQTHFVASCSEA